MKQIFTILLISVCINTMSAQNNIYTEISESPDHKILTELLTLTQIYEILNDGNYYSIFAPNDDAFLTAFDSYELDSLKLNDQDLIQKYLLQHIINDTVEVASFDAYIPLYGNKINQFVDGAGNIIVGSSSGLPYSYLEYNVPATELENGRILWTYNNIIKISTDSLHQDYYPITPVLNTTGLLDSLKANDTLLTIISPLGQELNEYLDENISNIHINSPFLDSFMRRHIITGFYPIQEIQDSIIVTSWSDELLRFTVENDQYFINDLEIFNYSVEADGVFLFTMEPILPSNISNSSSSDIYTEISESDNHKILKELIDLSGIDTILNDGNYYSMFAPNDEAFMTAFDVTELDSLKLNAPDLIKKYLLHHIVKDSVELVSFTRNIPLYGNIISMYIDDSAEQIILEPTTQPFGLVDYDNPITEFENGRILWVQDNILFFSTDSLHQVFSSATISPALNTTGLQELLESNDTLLTIIWPSDQLLIEFLTNNNTDIYTNSPFLDSLMQRHIIDGFYPFQEIEDGLTVTTWSNDILTFTKAGNDYFVNDIEIYTYQVYADGAILYINKLILPPGISNTSSIDYEAFNLYPNPSNTDIYIQSANGNKQADIGIYTVHGQLVFKAQTQSEITKIDISDFKPGLYFVEYHLKNSKQMSKLVVH